MQCKSLLNKLLKVMILTTFVLFASPSFSETALSKCTIVDSTKGTALSGAKKWQDKFLDLFCDNKGASEAWILFDEGGFGGSGQFGHVLVMKNKVVHIGKHYDASKRPIDVDALDSKKFDSFKKDFDRLSKDLKDHWEKGSDMYENELAFVKKEGTKITITHRVKWRFGREVCKVHCDLADLFEKATGAK